MKKIFVLALVAVLAMGCNSRKHNKSAQDAATGTQELVLNDGHNSRNSLEYWGVYEGTLPAANAAGLKVRVTLNRDDTYTLYGIYVDVPGGEELNYRGKFTWDDAGSMITLGGLEDGIGRYKVEEGRIRLVDMSYKVIEGANAGRYILTKVAK